MNRYLLLAALVFALGFTAYAQNVVTKPTGESAVKLDEALSPQTRETLQKAMDSMDPTAAPTSSATEASADANEALVLDGKTVEHIPFSSLPAPVKSALDGSVRQSLSDSGK